MKIYFLIAKLLDYPTEELTQHLAEISSLVQQSTEINSAQKEKIISVIRTIESMPLLKLQGLYVDTFDMNGKHSLHITHHLYGEEGERGLAMADLVQHYQKYGWEISNGELPDYLPLILEFLSTIAVEESTAFLNQAANAIDILLQNLQQSEVFYSPLIEVILEQTNRIPVKQANFA